MVTGPGTPVRSAGPGYGSEAREMSDELISERS